MQASLNRRAWLGVIACAHVAVLLSWRPVLRHADAPAAQRAGELVFLTLPSARPRPAELPPRPAAPNARRAPAPLAPQAAVPDAPPAAAASAPQSITLPAPAGADPFAQAVPPTATLRDKTLRAVAGIDRQLRKESLNKFATVVESDTRLGREIARSQSREWVLEQTSDVGDGVTMKRYRKGNQEVCEYTNLVGARGQDPFRDGNKTKVMSCP